MAIFRIAISFLFVFSLSSAVYANCNTNIPGHYENRYTDNQDGTITDNMTGLMWAKCVLGTSWSNASQLCKGPSSAQQAEIRAKSLTWQEALNKVVEVNTTGGYAGYNDWRLPNVKEAASIMEPACLSDSTNMALDTTYFKTRTLSSESSQASEYWSSTPHREVQADPQTGVAINQAWKVVVRFPGDFGARPAPITTPIAARLVRGTGFRGAIR